MTKKPEKVGFIGLGLMGLSMATNLLKAGVDLAVYNRTPEKAKELKNNGAFVAETPTQLAKYVSGGFIIICVSDTAALSKVMSDDAGILQADLTGTLVVDMGTSKVDVTHELARQVTEKGGAYIDAPVSGGAVGAQAGTLSIMAGGAVEDIKRAGAIFDIMGSSTTHIGDVGAGQVAKAANQMIVGATLSVVSEAMLLGKQAGVDLSKMRQALLGGFANSRILDLHGGRMIERNFNPGGHARTQSKDLQQAVELARSLGLTLSVTEHTLELWNKMVAADMGELDQSGYLKFVESQQNMANVKSDEDPSK